MRIAITGATGSLGQALIAYLVEQLPLKPRVASDKMVYTHGLVRGGDNEPVRIVGIGRDEVKLHTIQNGDVMFQRN